MTSDKVTPTRREFLRQQLGPVLLATFGRRPAHAAPQPPQAEASELVSLSRTAMASRFEVLLPNGDGQAVEAARDALELTADLERQMSVFREDSEISDINRRAAAEPVEIAVGLFGLLEAGARLAQETGGAFEIAAGALSRVWRICQREGRLPTEGEIESTRARVGVEHVRLDSERRTVEFAREGMELDLGAIGKGYALDQMAELLRRRGVADALLHAGYSSVCAMGGPHRDAGWLLSVRDPAGGDGPAARVRLQDQCMATSGSAEQFVEADGKRYGHIIDPRRGWPAEGVMSATCVAPTAAEADALSTAFYIMGVEATLEYCEKHPNVGALVIVAGESDGETETVTIGIPDDQLEAPT
ncbi:MAG: FAD:protein FMN transferase [Armatimonadota bacterium]|nr:MAG: FAD:protein FMN transferase [Armatimonadota bacterium]